MQIIPVDPIHPGEILREGFLKEYGISAYKAATDMGVPRTRIERVLRGENGITADTACGFPGILEAVLSSGSIFSAAMICR